MINDSTFILETSDLFMKTKISIIGGGVAAMMLACMLDESKFEVAVYEKNNALGRKFLVAGEGGLNITHSEDISEMINRYTPSVFLSNALTAFSNIDLRNWLDTIGIETFVGTSNRVFPKAGIKPIEVLNSIIKKMNEKNVSIKTQHRWDGWDTEGQLCFTNKNQKISVKSAITVFALGGASWKVTGSDGEWINHLQEKGVAILPFQPSNCAVKINWKQEFINEAEGNTLKNITVSCEEKKQKGEVVITKQGMEGGAIYALSTVIRKQLSENKRATLFIDLKPTASLEEIKNKLKSRGNKSITQVLESALKFNHVQTSLLKSVVTKDEFVSSELLSEKIKKLPLIIYDLAPIDEAISTVGGIPLNEIDTNFQLIKLKNNYAMGEMINWDAPTGGYLLQACFSIGFYLAKHLNEKY